MTEKSFEVWRGFEVVLGLFLKTNIMLNRNWGILGDMALVCNL